MSSCKQKEAKKRKFEILNEVTGNGQTEEEVASKYNIPDPVDKEKKIISDNREIAKKVKSGRGHHQRKITAPIPESWFPTAGDGEPVTFSKDKFIHRVVDGGEYKRVMIHRLDVTPLKKTDVKGNHLARIIIDYTVIDNLAFTTSVLLGSLGLTAVFTSGYFFVDEASEFVDSAAGATWSAVGAVVSIIGIYAYFKWS
jgi:hypothetical protein